MTEEIMSPEHKKWEKFCRLLEGKEGCNFQQKDPDDTSTTTWICKGGEDKSFTKAILKKYFPEINIERTMQYFENHGGYCDCEILFNVDE